MKYHVRERERYIRLLCTWLNVKESKNALKLNEVVRKFRAENGFSEGADVDHDVFIAIRDAYKKRMKNEKFSTLGRGNQSDDVARLNSMLRRLVPCFTSDIHPPKGSYFGSDTEAAVKYLRGVFMLDGESVVDGELYERMCTELAFQKFFDA